MTDAFDPQFTFDLLFAEAREIFLPRLPKVVVDQHWGDYGQAELVLKRFGEDWNADAVFNNRSVITLVNDHGFNFLLPIWLRYSYVSGRVINDVFEEVVATLDDRLSRNPLILHPYQEHAVARILAVFVDIYRDRYPDNTRFIEKLEQLCRQLKTRKHRMLRPARLRDYLGLFGCTFIAMAIVASCIVGAATIFRFLW